MSEVIDGLQKLLQDTTVVERLADRSSDGNIWAYADVGLCFPDEWMAAAVEEFNRGCEEIFDSDERPANLVFRRAGSTYESVVQGGISKSGCRIVEIDSEAGKIVRVFKQGREEVYVADDYRVQA
jgi:hypothetical protein